MKSKYKYIIFILLIIILVYLSLKINKIEGYYDIVPYKYNWNIFKCFDPECVKRESYKCYKYCDYIQDEKAAEYCRLTCADNGDIQFHDVKRGWIQFNYLFPKFKDVSILNDKNQEFAD